MPSKFRFTVANMLKATAWFAICCFATAWAVRTFHREDLIPPHKVEQLIAALTIACVSTAFAVAVLFSQPKLGYALGYAIAFVLVPIIVVALGALALLLT